VSDPKYAPRVNFSEFLQTLGEPVLAAVPAPKPYPEKQAMVCVRTETDLPDYQAGELLAMSHARCKRCNGLGRISRNVGCDCAYIRIFNICADYYIDLADTPESLEHRLAFERILEKHGSKGTRGRACHESGLFTVAIATRPRDPRYNCLLTSTTNGDSE
jgi:hypothetical protein